MTPCCDKPTAMAPPETGKTWRTARYDLIARAPSLPRFILQEIAGAATRLHNYRVSSGRLLDRSLSALDERHCE